MDAALREVDSTNLKLTDAQIEAKIQEKFKSNPEAAARSRTLSSILAPMLRSPDKLGLTPEQQTVIRNYARKAGERAAEQARNRSDFVTTIDRTLLPIIEKNEMTEPNIAQALIESSVALHEQVRSARQVIDQMLVEAELKGEPLTRQAAVEQIEKSPDVNRQMSIYISFGIDSYMENSTKFTIILKELGLIPQNATYEQVAAADIWQDSGYEPGARSALLKGIKIYDGNVYLRENNDPNRGDFQPRRSFSIVPSKAKKLDLLAAESDPPVIIPQIAPKTVLK